MFAPFTIDEIESIRSIVQLEQQKNDMLLSNCSNRPLPQIRSFIRRFKRSLLDSAVTSKDITSSANEQYVGILAGIHVKKNPTKVMKSTISVSNLASPLYKNIGTLPLKFRSKYGKSYEGEPKEEEINNKRMTRSRSISDGMSFLQVNNVVHENNPTIPLIPPLEKKLLKSYKDVSEIKIGSIAALMSNLNGTTFVCRILGTKKILGVSHLLVSFFQPDIKPCYVQPQNLIKLPDKLTSAHLELPKVVNVDEILEKLMQTSHYAVNEIPSNNNQFVHKYVQFKSISIAAQLILLEFIANNKIPPEKLKIILDSFPQFNPNKFSSTEVICDRCKALLQIIISSLC